MTSEHKESNPFYHRAAWKRLRALALMRDQGMCQECMRRLRAGYGIRPRPADMVHHIVPIEERPDLALRLDNVISLCNECHNREHPEKGGSRREAPERPKMRVIKV